jgi:hypothetical protein
MKMNQMKVISWLLPLLGILLAVTLEAGQPQSPPDAYLKIPQKQLLQGASALRDGTRHTDNLLHKRYFWEFEQPPEDLASLLSQLEARPADDDFQKTSSLKENDTPWVLPLLENALLKKIPKGSISRGYKI